MFVRPWKSLMSVLETSTGGYRWFPSQIVTRSLTWSASDKRVQVKLGKTAVLITGCDSGLGYSFARHCMDSLGLVVIACCLNPSGEGAASLLKDYQRGLHVLKLDLLSRQSMEDMKKQVEELTQAHEYEIHAVVNNSGIMTMGAFEWLTFDQIFDMVTVNLLGAMGVTKLMLPFLRDTKGRIVNISSHCSLASMPGLSVYGATKSALEAWSTALRMELENSQVDVVTLIPGSYVTQSRILKGLDSARQKMWESMPSNVRLIHENHFNLFYEYLDQIPIPELAYITDEGLLEKFDRALLSSAPRRTYVHGPFRYRLYFFLFSISPTLKIKEYFVRKFVNLPGF